MVEPRPGLHDPPVGGIDRGHERARRHRGQEDHVRRVQGGRRVVGGQHEQEQVVVEGLDRVVRDGGHHGTPALVQRGPQLGDEHEQEPQQEQVAHDPGHVRQPAPEHEEHGQPQDQRQDRDGPAPEPADDGQARGGRRRGTVGHVAARVAGSARPSRRQ